MREVRVSLVFFRERETTLCVQSSLRSFKILINIALMKHDILSCRASEACHVVVTFQKRVM
jgi:hypothetical protein